MKTLHKYIIGTVASLLIVFTFLPVAKAHGGYMMNDGFIDDDPQVMIDNSYDHMRKMHDLMWSDKDSTEDEFDWLADEQKEHMGFSWIEDKFSNVDEFNQWRESRGSNSNMMNNSYGSGCPMF